MNLLIAAERTSKLLILLLVCFANPVRAFSTLKQVAIFEDSQCFAAFNWHKCTITMFSDKRLIFSLMDPIVIDVQDPKLISNDKDSAQKADPVIEISGSSILEYDYQNLTDLKSDLPAVVGSVILLPFTLGLSASGIAAKRVEHLYVYKIKYKDRNDDINSIIVNLKDAKKNRDFYPSLREVADLDMGIKR